MTTEKKHEITKEEVAVAQKIVADAIKGKTLPMEEAVELIKKEMRRQKVKFKFDIEEVLIGAIEKTGAEISRAHGLICELFEMNGVTAEIAIHAMMNLVGSIIESEGMDESIVVAHFENWKKMNAQRG